MLQFLPYFHGPLLVSLHYVHASLVVESTDVHVISIHDETSVLSREEHSAPPASNTLPIAVLDTISFLCGNGTLSVHGQLGVHLDTQVLFTQHASKLGGSSTYRCLGSFLPR